MRRFLSLGVLAILATASHAPAGDFTGAYAGVNAGYGLARGRDAKTPGTGSDRVRAMHEAANDLPPSAAFAAKFLQRNRPAASR